MWKGSEKVSNKNIKDDKLLFVWGDPLKTHVFAAIDACTAKWKKMA